MIVYQINANAPLWYKTTCSESESRNFDCQWTLVSFLVKHNQFYREARLTCPLCRSTEDICKGIYVFKRVFNVWHMLKKVCQCNNSLNNLWENKEELNWSLLEILLLRQCWLKVQISFHWKSCEGHSTSWNIFRSRIDHQTLWKTLNRDVKTRDGITIWLKNLGRDEYNNYIQNNCQWYMYFDLHVNILR